MRTFARKAKAPQQPTPAVLGRDHPRQGPSPAPILHLQRTIGNHAVQRMLRTAAHEHEHEADRVAETVMRAPAPQVQRASLGRSGGGGAGQIAAPPIVHDVLRSPGQPIDRAARDFMEPRFGIDFSGVRVHTGEAADASARAVNAHAYAVGQHVVFAAGQFSPDTYAGRRLFAHELTHVVQQDTTGPTLARSPDDGGDAAIGSEIERLELQEWRKSLEAQGYEMYTRRQFDRVDWLAKAFTDGRARPDMVAVNRAKRHVLVGDVTAGPWSQADLRPGDRRKLPSDIGAEKEMKPHLEKTIEYARQASRKLPDELKGFRVTAQDLWWKEGTMSREITVARGTRTAPTSGTPPTSPTGGGAAGDRDIPSPAEPAAGERFEETGAPLEPVIEATPGFRPGAGAGIGGAIQLLQAMQVSNLQRDEVDKFQERFAELEPKIDAYMAGGGSVELILIVEKPNRPDVFCAAGAYCEQDQVILFHDLYINYVEYPKPARPMSSEPPRTGADTRGGAGSFRPHSKEAGGTDIEEKSIPYLSTRDKDHHCEYAKHTLYPPVSLLPIEPARAPVPAPPKPKPKLDAATKAALALAPSRVYLLSENIRQYTAAADTVKKLAGNGLFVVVKEDMGGGLGRTRTVVSYFSDLDKARAEALAEIVRAGGIATARAELSGGGDDAPGVLQIFFGRDAER